MPSSRRVIVPVAIFAVSVPLVGGIAWFLAEKRGVERDAALERAESAEQYAADVVATCEGRSPKSRALRGAGVCPDAKDVVDGSLDPDALSAADRVEVAAIAREVVADEPGISFAEVVAEVRRRIDVPRDGRDGKPPTRAEVRAVVEAVYAADPPPPGQDGVDGTDGANGADGRGIKSVDINAAGELVITYSDGVVVNLGRVVGPEGKQGPAGKNGAVTPGVYRCPEGEVSAGFEVLEGGAVQLFCESRLGPLEPVPE